MARVDVEQVAVLTAVVTRLQTVLSLNDRNCYPVARSQDVPTIPPGGDYWLTVAPGGGTFVDEEQAAGNVTEDSEIVVSGFTRIKTDSTSHDAYLLMDDARGLLAVKKLILGALVGQDLVDEDGNTFLRWLLHARRCDGPDLIVAGRDGVNCGVVRVSFGVQFDWSL
jgi:hypothetical protein